MCAQVYARRLYSAFEQSILAEHNIHNDTAMEQFMFQSHRLIKVIHWRYLKLIVPHILAYGQNPNYYVLFRARHKWEEKMDYIGKFGYLVSVR